MGREMSKTKWYQKPIYLLFALALVLSLGIVAVPMAGIVGAATPIYVNGSTGNDSWDGESAVWDGVHGPKKTIGAGIAAVDTPGTVHVAAGTYPENIILKGGVEVLGAGADVTTINGGGSGTVVTGSSVGSTTKLDGFNITNGSATWGGGIRLRNSSPTISNCIISGNSATSHGGGMSIESWSSPTVTNCILQGNSASGEGGGMDIYDWSSPTVTNCIFQGNNASSGGGIYASVSSPSIDYNDVYNNSNGNYWGCVAGPHDISQDSLFVNPAGHDYHSQPHSPCIDAGTNAGAPTEDIEGNPRPIDGDGDGIATTDMGAYEYVPRRPPPDFKYLHSEGSLIDLAQPVGTQWHELWPIFCRQYHLSSWEDNGDGVLSHCDWIDMYEKPDGEVEWYHVENVTITLLLTPVQDAVGFGIDGLPPLVFIELEGGYDASVLMNPEGTQWHEIYPFFCVEYQLVGWADDGNPMGELSFCDYIVLEDKQTGRVTEWHVEDVATDIVVTPGIPPPPVGGEAYPVNKASLLAPWIAVGLVLAGGTIWYVLRRRRAQSWD